MSSSTKIYPTTHLNRADPLPVSPPSKHKRPHLVFEMGAFEYLSASGQPTQTAEGTGHFMDNLWTMADEKRSNSVKIRHNQDRTTRRSTPHNHLIVMALYHLVRLRQRQRLPHVRFQINTTYYYIIQLNVIVINIIAQRVGHG